MPFLDPPLKPRNGYELNALTASRISTVHQDKRNNDDQQAYCKNYAHEHYDGKIHWTIISGQGSGERLDRKELRQMEELVESGAIDVVIVEDLARICRRNRAIDFCELCEDNNCRLIAINDAIDTGKEDWRLNAFFATFRHELYNKDTSKRIKRTLRNRFTQGGVFQCAIYGYIKPKDAKRDADVTTDKYAEPIYDEWFRMLETGASYSEISDWLNNKGIPCGKYCRDKRWTGRMVRRITFNPILKGNRQRNRKESKRINKTGRRRSVDASPEKLLTRFCPHLVFVEPDRYDRVILLMQKKHEACARGRRRNTPDSRKGVAKKRTVWPGQHVQCGICHRLFYWGGHGQKEHLQCSGSRDYNCWNATTFDGRAAARLLTEAILTEIEKLPDFDSDFAHRCREKAEAKRSAQTHDVEQMKKKLDRVLDEIDNVTDAIASLKFTDVLGTKLTSLMIQRDELQAKLEEIKKEAKEDFVLPSMDEIRKEARQAINALAIDSPEFGRLLHRLLPQLEVYPVRLCDGGAIVLRAKLTLDLTPLARHSGKVEPLATVLRRELWVDLFQPPQRAAYRERVVKLRADGLTEKQVATTLNITVTAAQKAAALHRLMEVRKLTDPYVPVTEPPPDYTKLRRHLHPRYRFEPLVDHPAT